MIKLTIESSLQAIEHLPKPIYESVQRISHSILTSLQMKSKNTVFVFIESKQDINNFCKEFYDLKENPPDFIQDVRDGKSMVYYVMFIISKSNRRYIIYSPSEYVTKILK